MVNFCFVEFPCAGFRGFPPPTTSHQHPTPVTQHHHTHHQPLPTTCSLARTLAGATYSPRVRWRDTRAARSIPRDWLSQQSRTKAISFCGSLTSTLDHRRLKCMKDAGCNKLRVRQRLMHREWHFRWLALVLNKPTLAWPKVVHGIRAVLSTTHRKGGRNDTGDAACR